MSKVSSTVSACAVVILGGVFATLGWAQQMPISESFDSGSLQRWHFSCQKELVNAGSGNVLRVSGAGHALWLVQAKDFTLKFRYRYQAGKGTGDVVLRASGSPPNTKMYSLRLEPTQIVLCRRTRTAQTGFNEQQLNSGHVNLAPNVWHNVTVRLSGGRFDVSVAGKQVLSANDAQPLPPGRIGLGIIAGSGAVEYDDAVYTPGASTVSPPSAGSGQTGADLAVTDIFADRLRNGRLFVRITNRGPGTLQGKQAELTTVVNGQALAHIVGLYLTPGKTLTHNTGRMINSSAGPLKVKATIKVHGFSDPNANNNSYREMIPQAKKP